MLTIIIGAGASFDSAPHNASSQAKSNQWRPPLTQDLFSANAAWSTFSSARLKMHGDLLPVIERIRRDTQSESLEAALLRLKMEIDEYPDRWRQLLAVQDWISKVIGVCADKWSQGLSHSTAYVDLVARVGDWGHKNKSDINFVTFNYDTLLENAIKLNLHEPLHFKDFDNYILGKYRVFKPHGSIDWLQEVCFDSERKNIQEKPLSNTEKSSLRLHIGSFDGSVRTEEGKKTYANMRAVSVPVATKNYSDFMLPPGHMDSLREAFRNTTALLVIGWAGNEEHFMDELSKNMTLSVPTLVVCGRGGADTISNLSSLGKISTAKDTNFGFAEFLDGQDLEDWLLQI